MQRIRRISIAALIVLLLYALSFSALAHSGRTDSSGGHTNHSTGEYHYHHGYSAHQHYDMNGDGIKDCPYKFKDNKSNKSEENKKINTDLKIVIAIIAVVLLAFGILLGLINKRK